MSSYLVIARKWRPVLFEDIVGQGHVTRTLKNAITSGRIAHAYLFSGPRGVGKTTAARILAKGLNCASGPTPAPCNTCESCRGIAAGSSVDVIEVDGASNNSVDNIREITESVRYVPGQGKYKVYIIDEVHMLSTPAFNALLKTLEEPPPHAVFIFATTEVHKIPATILSRCQRFDFKRIPFREIQQRLKKIVEEEGIKYEEQALFTLAREADGSLRDAQSLLEQALAFGAGDIREAEVAEALGLMDRSVLFELSEAIASGNGTACLNIVEKIYNYGYDLKRACSDLLEHIRDLTVLKVTGEASLLDLPDSELERLRAISGAIGRDRLQTLFGIISKGYEEVARGSSPRFSFEMALLRAAHCEDLESVSSLISRLEALKGGVGLLGGAVYEEARPSKAVKVNEAPQAYEGPKKALQTDRAEARSAVAEAPPAAANGARGLTELISAKIPSLSEPLQGAEIVITGDGVEITTAKEAVFRIKEKQIEALAAEYLKRPRLKVTVKAGNAVEPDKKKEPDTLVKDALRILGGRVIEDRRRSDV